MGPVHNPGIEKRDEARSELEERILSNTKELVIPYLTKLKKNDLNDRQKILIEIIESNLEDIISPFVNKLSSKYLNFTPTELRVANLVKTGQNTKEIAELLNVSKETISNHRKAIRKKLQLTNKKSNLRTHLISLS